MSNLKDQLSETATLAENAFRNLDSLQLNWRPHPKKWSIAQCLEHLMKSDRSYFPIFDKIISGSYHPSWWARMSPLSRFWGQSLIKYSGAVVRKKIRNPGIFSPTFSEIDDGILARYLDQMEVLKDYFERIDRPELLSIKIHSPVSRFVTYSLGDTITLLAGHERRHVNQALNMMHHPEFPKQKL